MKELLDALARDPYEKDELTLELAAHISPIYDDVPDLPLRAATIDHLESLRDDINAKIAEIMQNTLEFAQCGVETPGFVIKEGKSSRKITNEKAAAEFLARYVPGDELYERKFKTITALERALGAHGMKPADREQIMKQVCTVSKGSDSLVRGK